MPADSKLLRQAAKRIEAWTTQVENGELTMETDNVRHYRIEGNVMCYTVDANAPFHL